VSSPRHAKILDCFIAGKSSLTSTHATTIDIVSADLAFLSSGASKDSIKICNLKNKDIIPVPF
jgi:hypothetical protein